MSTKTKTVSKPDLKDPHYLVDTNFIIDILDVKQVNRTKYVDWIKKMIPKKSVFLVLDSVVKESHRSFNTIKGIFAPFSIDVKRIPFDDPVIQKQYEFLKNDFAYALPEKELSDQDMQILAVSMVNKGLKVITNDGQLQYAIMDSQTKDLDGNLVAVKYADGIILDHRKAGFSKGDIYNSYASLLFNSGFYEDAIRISKEGIRYLEDFSKHLPPHFLMPYDSDATKNTHESLLKVLGWAYVKIGTPEEILDIAQQILDVNQDSKHAEKFFDISKQRKMNPFIPNTPKPAPTPKISRRVEILRGLDATARYMTEHPINPDPYELRTLGEDHLDATFGKNITYDMDGNSIPVLNMLPITYGSGAGSDALDAAALAFDI